LGFLALLWTLTLRFVVPPPGKDGGTSINVVSMIASRFPRIGTLRTRLSTALLKKAMTASGTNEDSCSASDCTDKAPRVGGA